MILDIRDEKSETEWPKKQINNKNNLQICDKLPCQFTPLKAHY